VIWLTWRQHRAEALAVGLLVAALGIILYVLGEPMRALFPQGVAQCTVVPVGRDCQLAVTRLQQGYEYATPMLILLNFVPFGIGAFLGAPLLAREWESGTWQLAWTQAIPRLRWLAVKLGALGALAMLSALAFSAAVTWYRQPLDLFGHFEIDGFDVVGIAPMAYALFAFAVSAAFGLLLRRSLPALAIALVVFVAVRFTVAGFLRPHYRAPIRLTEAIPPGSGEVRTNTASAKDWIIGQGVQDSTGRRLSGLEAAIVEHKAMDAGLDPTTYLHDNGYQRWVVYQPANRFWPFQLIEGGLFVGLSVILLVLVVRRIRRRAG
jgi:hypothetical protein